MSRFAGRTAIVTGYTRGIGESTARRLAGEGAGLVLVARSESELELPTEAVVVRGSVAEASTAEAAVEAALSRFGQLDVLVNNAGVDFVSDLLDADEADVRAVFDTNFFGALVMLQAAAGAMPRGGSIVNVTSRLASIGVAGMTVYGASKGALLSLTRGAAIDLAERGIRVNAVAPGLTATPLFDEWVSAQADPESFRREIAATIPQGRVGSPEEVAAAVAFLASEEAAHITGASLPVDGGYTAA
jgi:NAD(P)-dependent dehydrogenase (short-subunit alcohol dehydrogenase family)